jgi:hypothetical protein
MDSIPSSYILVLLVLWDLRINSGYQQRRVHPSPLIYFDPSGLDPFPMSLTYVTDLYHLVKSTKSSPSIEDLQALGQFLNFQSLPADIVDLLEKRITFSSALGLEEEVDLFCLDISAFQKGY